MTARHRQHLTGASLSLSVASVLVKQKRELLVGDFSRLCRVYLTPATFHGLFPCLRPLATVFQWSFSLAEDLTTVVVFACYITEGRHEFIAPGSKFLAFSFIEPNYDKMFIGKKSALANIEKKEKVTFKEKKDEWTTEDMIYLQEYEAEKNKEIFGIRLVDATARFLVGRFKVSNLLEVEFEDRIYKFYSLWKRYGEIQSNLE